MPPIIGGMIHRTSCPSRAAANPLKQRADAPPLDAALLIDIHGVAALLSCSTRHVEDMTREALMPSARKLGRLNRWEPVELREWVRAGCPGRGAWEAMKNPSPNGSSDGDQTRKDGAE
jgi:predicted DNA-binding transcriptional regulator AlpA